MKLFAVALLLALLAGCSQNQARENTENAADKVADKAKDVAGEVEDRIDDKVIEMRNTAFVPPQREIGTGVEVTWINRDNFDHTVTFESVAFDETIKPDKEASFRFTQKGDYTYYCTIHGRDVMSGIVKVT